MAQTPSCNDSIVELLFKILLQFQSMARTSVSSSLLPACNDSAQQLYSKILLTLPLL